MKKLISLLFIMIVITGCTSTKYETIDTNKAIELIDNGAIIVDVRNIEEFSSGHIVNAINYPLEQIDMINLDVNTPIIVYCATGIKSKEAASKLSEMGYLTIYILDGGLLNWGGALE